MSKGSNRRPEDSDAFRRSWEKIFGKREVPTTNMAAFAEAVAKHGTHPGKVWSQHEDGTITPANLPPKEEDKK